MGSERDYDAWPLAGMNDVMVVIPNYRVGIFGFLSLGKNSCCTGNAGLMDQQEVMRWVGTHIEDFGGDATNITLIGESAGANSVHMHLVSPLSRGLFHKAISQSGQVFMEEGFQTEENRSKSIASLLSKLNVGEQNDVKILETLQSVPADALVGLSAALMGLSDEGFELCKKEYLREDENETKYSKLLGDIISNGLFIAPAVNSAQIHSGAGADVYCYIAKYQLRMHHDPEFGKEVCKKAAWCQCDHGDDVYMTFGAPFYPKNLARGAKFSDEEKKISRNFMTYITNFARTGNPNKGKSVSVEWPKYD